MTEESTSSNMEVEDTNKPKDENVTPSASGENAAKYPDMKLAQSIHKLIMISKNKLQSDEKSAVTLKDEVLKQVVEEMENPSLYRFLTKHGITSATIVKSESELEAMQTKNNDTMKSLEEKVEEAKENAGDMEVLDARFEIGRFAAKTLSKDEALEAYAKVVALPKLSSGKTMDALMESSRIASFYDDLVKNSTLVQKIAKLADDSGDWDRRNRVKIYSALTKLLSRDVKTAAPLLIDCIATFSCAEICTYTEFIVYTVITNILYLSRTELKKKIIDGPEILSVAHDIPVVIKLVNTLYDCDYKGYLQAMVDLEQILRADRFLQPHCGYIMRELHVLGYKQFLDSYKSVTLESMAASFGVSAEFLDLQLGRFIAAGRLTAKIDKFGGVVETNRPDLKNAQYRDMIQQGDLLLNRIQKLARVVDL